MECEGAPARFRESKNGGKKKSQLDHLSRKGKIRPLTKGEKIEVAARKKGVTLK